MNISSLLRATPLVLRVTPKEALVVILFFYFFHKDLLTDSMPTLPLGMALCFTGLRARRSEHNKFS